MKITGDTRDSLNLALNESKILNVEFDRLLNTVKVMFECIAMNEDGKIPADTRIVIKFSSVGRFVGSHRLGDWNDDDAEVLEYELEQLSAVLQNYNGQSQYGWEFINNGDEDFNLWKDRLSFDYTFSSSNGFTNTIDLFTEQYSKPSQIIDLRIWFDEFEVTDVNGIPMATEDFIERGRRG